MFGSLALLVLSILIAFGLEGSVSLGVLILGHSIGMLAAVGVKLGYIIRLNALSGK